MGKNPPIVLLYTSAGNTSLRSKNKPFIQSIAYSNDFGRSWIKYDKNPVLNHIVGMNRDPKVFWHKDSQKWVMALYLEGNEYGLFASPNLKEWEELCRITVPGAGECPDMFELPVNGDPSNTRRVFWAANGTYLLGAFDGQRFRREGDVYRLSWGDSYAAQTWNDAPNKRRIQIAWLRVNHPGMPFNQQMTFPCELKLRKTEEGIRLFGNPVWEIQRLHRKRHFLKDLLLADGTSLKKEINADLLDVYGEFYVKEASKLSLSILGVLITYNVEKETLHCLSRIAPLKMEEGKISLRIFLDRASVEVFGNDGRVSLPIGVIIDYSKNSLEICSDGGRTMVDSLEIRDLSSAWLKQYNNIFP